MSDDTPQNDRYYTVAEAARILRRTPASVRHLCVEHIIPATKPAGTWLIPVEEFNAWLRAGANEALGATA